MAIGRATAIGLGPACRIGFAMVAAGRGAAAGRMMGGGATGTSGTATGMGGAGSAAIGVGGISAAVGLAPGMISRGFGLGVPWSMMRAFWDLVEVSAAVATTVAGISLEMMSAGGATVA